MVNSFIKKVVKLYDFYQLLKTINISQWQIEQTDLLHQQQR